MKSRAAINNTNADYQAAAQRLRYSYIYDKAGRLIEEVQDNWSRAASSGQSQRLLYSYRNNWGQSKNSKLVINIKKFRSFTLTPDPVAGMVEC